MMQYLKNRLNMLYAHWPNNVKDFAIELNRDVTDLFENQERFLDTPIRMEHLSISPSFACLLVITS